jgi:hypothetical protein
MHLEVLLYILHFTHTIRAHHALSVHDSVLVKEELHSVVVKESELYVIIYKTDSEKIKGEVRV